MKKLLLSALIAVLLVAIAYTGLAAFFKDFNPSSWFPPVASAPAEAEVPTPVLTTDKLELKPGETLTLTWELDNVKYTVLYQEFEERTTENGYTGNSAKIMLSKAGEYRFSVACVISDDDGERTTPRSNVVVVRVVGEKLQAPTISAQCKPMFGEHFGINVGETVIAIYIDTYDLRSDKTTVYLKKGSLEYPIEFTGDSLTARLKQTTFNDNWLGECTLTAVSSDSSGVYADSDATVIKLNVVRL